MKTQRITRVVTATITLLAIFTLTSLILLVVGCGEGMEMAKDVVSPDLTTEPVESEDTKPEKPTTADEMKQSDEPETLATEEVKEEIPAVTMGEMKQGESDITIEEVSKPETQTAETNRSSPKIKEVGWYKDWRGEHPLPRVVCSGTHIHIEIVFSEPMKHTAGTGDDALPALFVRTGNTETRFEVLPDEPGWGDYDPGTCKRVRGPRETIYRCRYVLPTNISTSPTITLRVGENTTDAKGNPIAGTLSYTTVLEVPVRQETVILPENITIPANTTLSRNEKDLATSFTSSGWNPTKPSLQTEAGKLADRISILPLQDREEAYDAFVALVDLPFFAEAAKKMKEEDINLIKLYGEAVKTGNWNEFDNFFKKSNQELGIFLAGSDFPTLEDIYFEENPEEKIYNDKRNSRYWMLLEYYRIQLEYPHLTTFLEEAEEEARGIYGGAGEILCVYRESARAGNIFGLENPWE